MCRKLKFYFKPKLHYIFIDPVLNDRHVFLMNYVENCLLVAMKFVRTLKSLSNASIRHNESYLLSCIEEGLSYCINSLNSKYRQNSHRLPFARRYLTQVGRFAFSRVFRKFSPLESIRKRLKIKSRRVRIYNDLSMKIKY